VTAAIGDGANDVSMIEEADVGIGNRRTQYEALFNEVRHIFSVLVSPCFNRVATQVVLVLCPLPPH